MKRKFTKLTLYSATLLSLIGVGIKINNCKRESQKFTKKVMSYIDEFEDDEFLIAAHRGYSSLAVENTKESIALASDKDYIDFIELDARITKDNKVVLAHDNTLLTRGQQSLVITDENFDSLTEQNFYYLSNSLGVKIENLFNTDNGDILRKRASVLDSSDYNIISLSDGLEACCDKRILLDLKFENNVQNFIDALDEELKNKDVSNIIFQSDDLLPLLCLQQKHPEYTCLAIIKNTDDLEYIDLFDHIGLRYNLVNKKLVKKLLEADKTVAIWTLNNPCELKKVTDKLGDYYKDVIYISDYPDVIATCLNEQQKRREKTLTQQ